MSIIWEFTWFRKPYLPQTANFLYIIMSKGVLLESSHGTIVPRKTEELGGIRRNFKAL